MENKARLFTALFLILFSILLLLNPSLSLFYAGQGLNLWFQKMIPSLFPFMVISAFLIKLNVTEKLLKYIYPLFYRLFHVSYPCVYVIVIGFLCGFPMGAVAVSQLRKEKQLSLREADYLLAFCNNIGPVYFISYALPVIGLKPSLPVLAGMYGIPFAYGILLRYTFYRDLPSYSLLNGKTAPSSSISECLQEALWDSIQSITRLGGYMIVFNLLNLLPRLFLSGHSQKFTALVVEINGGLEAMGNRDPVLSLCALSFCGLCCLMQINCFLQPLRLSTGRYFLHKLFLTSVCFVYYSFLIL